MRPLPLIYLLLASCLASCVSAHKVLEREAMVNDLYRLEKRLRKTHPAVGITVSAAALAETAKKIEQQLPARATLLTYASLIHPLVDTLNCGHVSLYPKGALWRYLFNRPKKTLPLSLKRLSDGQVIIQRAAQNIDSMLLGAEVFAINGRNIQDVVSEIATFTGGSDGINTSGSKDRATEKVSSHINWVLGDQDSFSLHFVRRNSAQPEHLILPAFDIRASAEQQKKDETTRPKTYKGEKPIGYGFDSLRRVAIIDVNSFSGYDPFNILYPTAVKGVFAKAKKDSAVAVILDLRDNGGGRSANIANLLKHVVKEPTRIYTPWTYKRAAFWHAHPAHMLMMSGSYLLSPGPKKRFGRLIRKRIKPAKKYFKGDVLVLANSGTFSAAAGTASILKSNRRAVIAGEEAGGNYHETYAGLFAHMSLRKTGLRVRIPIFHIPLDVDKQRQNTALTLQPDVRMPVTVRDVLDDRDLVLLQALQRFEIQD